MCQNNPNLPLSHVRRKHSNSWECVISVKKDDEAVQMRVSGVRREVPPGSATVKRN